MKSRKAAILSLSLLTVMAGAAVAPALDIIADYFSDASALEIQLVISLPALFIFGTSLIFPWLCRKMKSRTLLMTGLILYVAGGSIAGIFNHIGTVLAARSLVGIGVGIIMPLSTGLLGFYFPPKEQDGLMGWASAMNQMGAVIATLLSGALAQVSWRLSFLVYLMGIPSIILTGLFLPNDRLNGDSEKKEKESASEKQDTPENQGSRKEKGTFARYYPFIISMFLVMITFFLYPTNFAMETAMEGVIPGKYTAFIMAFYDFVAFLGGLSFVHIKIHAGKLTRFVAPVLFVLGYFLLIIPGPWFGTVAGSALVGFANGVAIPHLMTGAGAKAGKSAATTVMPMLSAALYIAQFAAPFLMSAVRGIFGEGTLYLPYITGIVTGLILLIWNTFKLES